jgi:hypothetical protein
MSYKSLLIVGAVGVLGVVAPNLAHAQETQECGERELVKAGTWEATAKTAGLIVGARWGSGTVTLNNGDAIKFTFEGAKLMEIGGSETKMSGTIYNLDNKADFFGTYLGIGGGLTAVTANLGGTSITNGKCVVLNGEAVDGKGLRLSAPIGPGGVIVKAAE